MASPASQGAYIVAKVGLTYLAVLAVGSVAVVAALMGPSSSLPADALGAFALAAPSLAVAAAVTIALILSRRFGTTAIAAASGATAAPVGAVTIALVELNHQWRDPDAFFDPAALVLAGGVTVVAVMGLIAGALAGAMVSRVDRPQ